MNTEYQFMVDCTLPEEIPAEFHDLIPYQRLAVERFLSEGKLVNYVFSEDRGKLWAIFNADSEMEVLEFLVHFPLMEFMKVEIAVISTYQTTEHPAPNFSLN